MRVAVLLDRSLDLDFLRSANVGEAPRSVLELAELPIERVARSSDIFHRLQVGKEKPEESGDRQDVGGILPAAQLEIGLALWKPFHELMASSLHAEVQRQAGLENFLVMRVNRVDREDTGLHSVDTAVLRHHLETGMDVIVVEEIVGVAKEAQVRWRRSHAGIARRSGSTMPIALDGEQAEISGRDRLSQRKCGVRRSVVHHHHPALHSRSERSLGKMIEAGPNTLDGFGQCFFGIVGGNDNGNGVVRGHENREGLPLIAPGREIEKLHLGLSRQVVDNGDAGVFDFESRHLPERDVE